MQESVLITHLKIPPSSHNQYVINRSGPIMSYDPSPDMKQFLLSVAQYPCSFPAQYATCKQQVREWVLKDMVLQLHCTFFMRESRLYYKNQQPKPLDLSSRIEICHKYAATLMEIDKALFFKSVGEKCVAHDTLGEMTCIEISPLHSFSERSFA